MYELNCWVSRIKREEGGGKWNRGKYEGLVREKGGAGAGHECPEPRKNSLTQEAVPSILDWVSEGRRAVGPMGSLWATHGTPPGTVASLAENPRK